MRHLGREFYNASDSEMALFKGKRIDTMRASMKWVDARFSSGRLKFPSLMELYSRCFPEETYQEHQALDDVRAVVRCLPVLVDEGLIELKVREYPDEPKLFDKSHGTAPNLNETPTSAPNIAESENGRNTTDFDDEGKKATNALCDDLLNEDKF